MKWTMRRVHKWIAVSVSVLLLVWAVTGVVMIAPWPGSGVQPRAVRAPADWAGAVIPPVEAIARASATVDTVRVVRSVSLQWVGPRLVYDVVLGPGGSRLIDAATGERVLVTEELARAAAEAQYPGDVRAARIERMDRAARDYLAGPLPAYRVTFGDPDGMVAFVAVADGSVRWASRWGQLRRALTSLHDFYFVRVLVAQDAVRRWLVGITGTIAAVAVLTGMYLALPVAWRRAVARRVGLGPRGTAGDAA